MIEPFPFSPLSAVALFLAASAILVFAGIRLAGVADRLADRTGLGEALVGAVLVGAATSLAGATVSVSAASNGHASLAVSNGIGGIAVQTAFLGIADFAYRKANLEHAAAAPENLVQGSLLVTLLGIVLMAAAAPRWALFGVNPASVLLVTTYLLGVRLIAKARSQPMWTPTRTRETEEDTPGHPPRGEPSLCRLVLDFTWLVLLLGLGGYVIAHTAVPISRMSGLSETAIGALFTAIATSVPELVIAIAAVRRGAPTLAVGNILGGNCFDVLFVALSDVAYRSGSVYHAIAPADQFVIAVTIVMTGILLLGLLCREKFGVARIGFESVAMLMVYGAAVALSLLAG